MFLTSCGDIEKFELKPGKSEMYVLYWYKSIKIDAAAGTKVQILPLTLPPDEEVVIDSGHVAAFEDSHIYSIAHMSG